MKIFKDYYKFPLKSDSLRVYVWTADDQMAFNWCCNLPKETRQEIVDIINGTSNKKSEKEWIVKNNRIYYDDKLVLLTRGWGMLRGIGAYNLDEETAARIQDEFINYVVEQLNK